MVDSLWAVVYGLSTLNCNFGLKIDVTKIMEGKLFEAFDKIDRQQWVEKIIADLKGESYDSLRWQTAGLSGEPVFTQEDLPDPLPNLANVHEKGNRSWVNYQWIGVSSEKEANANALHALNQGADGIIFEVSQLPDWPVLLKEIDLRYCHLGLIDAGTENYGLAQSFQELYQGNEAGASKIRGFISQAEEKNGINPAGTSFKYLSLRSPGTVSPGLPVAELAAQLAQAAAVFDALTDEGVSPASLFSQVQFQLNMADSYFVEIAKFRAMRSLAVRFASAYGVQLKVQEVEILAMSSDWTSPLEDPHSHLLHATTQAMSAILGGADALCVRPFYSVFEDDSLAERAARNISTILKEEAYLNKVADPAAGSYLVESLTQQIAKQAWQLFLNTEKTGGINSYKCTMVNG